MASHLMRHAARLAPRLSVRAAGTSAVAEGKTYLPEELPQDLKDIYYPQIGNRDIVGYGWNGWPTYADRPDFPLPGVRFGENTPEVAALREKEKGDWSKLSMEDRKALYRASFCMTFAEMHAPTGTWKNVLAITFASLGLTGLILIWLKKYVYMELPITITEEWKERQTEHMVRQGQNPIEGVSSKWDYEKNQWK